MRPRQAFDFVWVGVMHAYLMSVTTGVPLAGDNGVHPYLDSYLTMLEATDQTVTISAAWPLYAIREELAAAIAADPNAILDAAMTTRIQQAALMIRETLYAEARNKTVFETTDKRYEVPKLLYDQGALLRPGTLELLPGLTAYDIREAGICIAYERPTAAAFHALRGTEQALRQLYQSYVRTNRMRKPWMWKAMLDALNARSTKPPGVLLANLESLRENFRNPTQHPEATYDIDESQDLFAACLDVLNRMVATPRWITPDDSLSALLAATAEAAPGNP